MASTATWLMKCVPIPPYPTDLFSIRFVHLGKRYRATIPFDTWQLLIDEEYSLNIRRIRHLLYLEAVDKNGKKILVHRLIMAEELAQKAAELGVDPSVLVVHHVLGNESTLDNRKDNLEILTKPEHGRFHALDRSRRRREANI